MGNPETTMHRILQESAPPAAPMAMAEQVLVRPRMVRGLLLKPLLQWLTSR